MFYMLIIFKTAKSYTLIVIEWAWSNMCVGLYIYNLLYRKNESMNCIDFLHAQTYLRMIKVTLGVHGQIWLWPFRYKVSKISFVSIINWWAEPIFCMLEMIQWQKWLSQYYSILPNFEFHCISCILPLVILGFPRLLMFYFSVSCCY